LSDLDKIESSERYLMMKGVYCLFFLFLSIALLISCGGYDVKDESSSGDDSSYAGTYFEGEDEHIIVVVDVELTRLRLEEKYFPLSIKIANKRLPSLTLTRDSFILIDDNRMPHYMPDIKELQKNYEKLTPDSKFRSQTGLLRDQMLTSFSYYRKADSNFFPVTAGSARVIDKVYVRQRGFMEDVIYFPMPPGGIKGKVLILRVDAEELEVPADIAFTVN
jgi:hypothetical protein